MAKIPQKVIERLIVTTGKYQGILKGAKDRDINEADTVLIVADMLEKVFGFDKFLEITSEYAIKGTYCDLAIKVNGEVQYLIEVKAIGTDLKEAHIRQAVDYGANQGIQWVVLTNGTFWEIYRIHFEKSVKHKLICSFNFLEINPKKADDREKMFLLCKRGLSVSAREEFHKHIKNVNRFIIGAILLSDSTLNLIKRDLKKLSPGLKIENTEIEEILRNDVMKREVLEGNEASNAKNKVKKISYKPTKKTDYPEHQKPEPPENQSSDKPNEENQGQSQENEIPDRIE